MIGEVKVHGIVLSSMPVGEYDRRITILTAEKGRISAFAKGARKPTSAFSACAQAFTYGEFRLYEGRDSYNLMQLDKPNYFSELRNDLEGMYYGMYFCELMGCLTGEGVDENDQMQLLYVALLALTRKKMPNKLIRCVLELRALANYGLAPLTEGLYYCGRKNGLLASDEAGSFKVEESTLYAVSYIITRPVKELFAFNVSESVLDQLVRICTDYLGRHVDRKLKSAELLDTF